MSINRTMQPQIEIIDKLNQLTSTKTILDNGIPFYQINAGTQDLIKLEFNFKAGLYYQSKKLLASFTNKMLSLGTKSFSAFDIAEKIDAHGAYLDTSVDKDNATVSIYCLNKHLSNLLPLLQEIIYEPTFSEKEYSILLNKSIQEYSINLEKVKYIAAVNFTHLIYGNSHPYGLVTEKEDFEKIQLSDLRNFYNAHYNQNNCTIIASGKISTDLTSQLNKYFGEDKKSISVTNSTKHNLDYSAQKHKIVKAGSLQSAIRIGKPIFNRLHPDFNKLSILNTVLGGYFGSRLMSNIREEKGYTYGIGSSLISMQNSGHFSIVTEVGAKFTDLAIEEIYKELKVLRTKKIPEEELTLVKNYITGQIIRSLDGPFALSDKLRMLIHYNLPTSYFQDFVEEINTTNSQNLIDMANQYLAPNSLTELVVGS